MVPIEHHAQRGKKSVPATRAMVMSQNQPGEIGSNLSNNLA